MLNLNSTTFHNRIISAPPLSQQGTPEKLTCAPIVWKAPRAKYLAPNSWLNLLTSAKPISVNLYQLVLDVIPLSILETAVRTGILRRAVTQHEQFGDTIGIDSDKELGRR